MTRGNNTDLALKLVGFSLLAALTLALAYQLRALIICLILAITLSSAIAPVAEAAQRRKIPRMATVLMLYMVAALMYGLIGAALVPAIHEQWQKMYENFPAELSELARRFQRALNLAESQTGVSMLSVEELRTLSVKLLCQTWDMSAGAVGLVLHGVLILFLTAYFVVEADKIWGSLLRWLPKDARIRFAPLIAPLAQRVGGYVRGQLLVAFAVGMLLVTGFSLLGVKYALLLGVVGGTLNLVPYVGSMIAVICAMIIAFNQTPLLAIAVLVFYFVEQWLESSLIVPFFLGKQVSLHPLIVLFSLLSGATLMGIPGALISVPVASVIAFFAEEFYLKAKAS